MTLNPLQFAEEVNKQYLRYQLTSARLADADLADQFENKIWGSNSPLFKGPFVSLSRAYKEGTSVESLVNEGILHNRMRTIIPYPSLYQHQEEALNAINEGKDTLVTTGTGSGKTEAFLYPIIDRCLELGEDPQAPDGVTAVVVYPMNALAADQLERLRELLVGTGITFGRYVGPTPEDEDKLDFEGRPLPEGTTREEFKEHREEVDHKENVIHLPQEERYTREQIREDPPRILLVNKAILEFQLTRGRDLDLFLDAPIEYVVMDEAHTNTGAQGAEVALLLRRLKELAEPPKDYISNIATSATIVDPEHDDEGQRFMSRLFGVNEDNVAIVRESYEGMDWPEDRYRTTQPPNPSDLFQRALETISKPEGPDRESAIEAVYHELTSQSLPDGDSIAERLFGGLRANNFAYQIHRFGKSVRELNELVETVWDASDNRSVREPGARDEVLTYLVLGAAAEKDDTPLFRPKLHYFVKGLEGAVAVLDVGDDSRPAKPTLFLNADEAKDRYEGRRDESALFPVKVCPQCGQHHYEQYLEDVSSAPEDELRGGFEINNGTYFIPDKTQTRSRILFTDTIVHSEEAEWSQTETGKHSKGAVCYACGCIHKGAPDQCGACDRPGTLLPIFILESVDKVKSCPVCQYNQGFGASVYDDPFRALREVTVANVYVLAQDMLNQADEEGKRLITFTDNRQEAAFQAGWMRDRARRYRFRRLLYDHLPEYTTDEEETPEISVATVVDRITETLDENRDQARIIAPEVFEEHVDSTYDTKFTDALERYVRIQVLREITESYNARASLESWGKLRIHYAGIEETDHRINRLAEQYGLAPEELVSWLRNFLDTARKRKMLMHQQEPIFSYTWDWRSDLVKNRYLPPIDFYPYGMRLERSPNQDSSNNVKVWIGKSRTGVQDWAMRLDLPEEELNPFLQDVWDLLVHELGLLARLDHLRYGGSGDPIPGTQNVYQVDAHKIGVTRQDERYQCAFCGRIHPRETPRNTCTRWRCEDGRIEPMYDEEPRDYDLVALEEADTFVMAAEHTAQVPNKQRDRIERAFKEGEGVNCLVATPTLELGVDIGALDMVLLRNVPPRPSNYWQRAGRAGRRNRMAIIYTYVRSNPHDLHFFKNPTAMLGGSVRPPSFNLRNPVMIQKHVHAAVLTQLHAEFLGEENSWLEDVIPTRVGAVVFEDEKPRSDLEPVVNPLREALEDPGRRERLIDIVESTFATNWPDDPKDVARDTLETYVERMPDELLGTYQNVLNRLNWAWQQNSRLAQKEADGEMLSEEEERFKRRCQSTINTLRPNYDPEDDDTDKAFRTYTLSVLSREGFLPGYATSRGSVVASAERAYTQGWDSFEFDINRPTSIAIHEHVPGNRIYANGGKYQVSYYKFPATDEVRDPREWHVNPERYAVQNKMEAEVGYNDPQSREVSSLPLVDSQLRFISHVEDIETTRFRMPSVIAGTLRSRHDGGMRYEFDDRTVDHLENQFVTILNFGPDRDDDNELGYPICGVCGGVRSPYENEETIERFFEYHEDKCGEVPRYRALHVHSEVDGLLFKGLDSEIEAVSLGEGLALLGTHLFDMERDDLRWIPLPEGDDEWELFLYDPMPGGSGLLEQFMGEWGSVIRSARDILGGCPSGCLTSCYDCLRTYYNQFYHEELDRHSALELLESMGETPTRTNVIESIDEIPDVNGSNEDTNIYEKQLEQIVTDEWGYSGFSPQVEVQLPDIGSYTIPDLAHEEGKIAIYLDGNPHFADEQRNKDNFLRQALKAAGWSVIEIHIQDYDNDQMMQMYRTQISNSLS